MPGPNVGRKNNSVSSNKERGEDALKKLEKELNARDRAEKSGPFKVAALALVAIVIIAGGIWYFASREDDSQTEASSDGSVLTGERADTLPDTVTCTYNEAGTSAKKVSLPQGSDISTKGTATLTLATTQGSIGMNLDRSVSPCAVNALSHLAQEKFYDNTICHRLTTEGIHVLQCGDPKGDGTGGPGFRYDEEYPTGDAKASTQQSVIYPRGSIAIAKSGKNTNGSQFFLNYQDSPLPPEYTYVGTVDDEGLKTLDAIAEKGTKDGSSDGEPAEEVHIDSATVK
nr:peptidylprolyl isomerase [Corynebacterium uropygiale]